MTHQGDVIRRRVTNRGRRCTWIGICLRWVFNNALSLDKKKWSNWLTNRNREWKPFLISTTPRWGRFEFSTFDSSATPIGWLTSSTLIGNSDWLSPDWFIIGCVGGGVGRDEPNSRDLFNFSGICKWFSIWLTKKWLQVVGLEPGINWTEQKRLLSTRFEQKSLNQQK